MIGFYFYHHYFHIQYNCCYKNYLLFLACNNFLLIIIISRKNFFKRYYLKDIKICYQVIFMWFIKIDSNNNTSSLKPVFFNINSFFYIFFLVTSNKQKNKENLVKGLKIYLKKKTTRSDNIVVNDIKIFQKIKSKGYLSIEKRL